MAPSSKLAATMLAALATGLATAQGSNIVVMGDSWAAFMAGDLGDDFCPGSTVLYNGVGGETIAGMLQSGREQTDGIEDADLIWLSIGGNDYLGTGCTVPDATILNGLRTIITTTSNAAPNATIMLSGYSPPSCSAALQGLCSLEVFEQAVRTFYPTVASEFDNVVYVDIFEQFGGDESTLSDASAYRDCIHINQASYETLLNETAWGEFLCPALFPDTNAAGLGLSPRVFLATVLALLAFAKA